MSWEIEFHEEFSNWFEVLEADLQREILANLRVLAEFGPSLRRPRVGFIEGSKFPQMKELVVQFKGEPWRILFAFDPERKALLLVGGNKTGNARWYKENIPVADSRFEKHLQELIEEKKKKGKESDKDKRK